MKNILNIAFIALGFMMLNAQVKETHNIPLSMPNESGKLVVNIVDGSIAVTGYDGNEVVVIAIGQEKNKSWEKPKKDYNNSAKNGMSRVKNNALEYTVEEINNIVYIRYTPGKAIIDFEVMVPHNFSVDLKTVNRGNILVDGLNGTHEVSNTNGKVTMTNVGGSVVADALNKDIVVGFKSINSNATMMFTSLNGDVDISFPKKLKANVIARSDFGNVYTDFEIDVDNSKPTTKTSDKGGTYKIKREKGIKGKINGGGANITFKTLNGDILIRSNDK